MEHTMKQTFGKLMLLVDLFSDDNQQLAEFAALGVTGGVTPDSDGTIAEFSCDEMEVADGKMYNIIIGCDGICRFFSADTVVFKHKVTGEYWALDCDELYEF
jgi:hypothetical protein